MSSPYLEDVNDGLPMRESQEYAKDKLTIVEHYVYRFITSMREKPWSAFYFVDLFAGPGKNIFESSKSIKLGSPLIALKAPYPFTQYRFVEMEQQSCEALQTRIAASERANRAKVIKGDCNVQVDDIVDEIQQTDRESRTRNQWSSLNLAFLDPEGLELEWTTVKKLGQINRMDLIINFSTSGFTRNADQLIDKIDETRIDSFFGTPEWKDVYQPVSDKDNTVVRRAMLDFYKKRLGELGYIHISEEQVFRNSKNKQVYTLMFVSKNPLGIKFWNDTLKEVNQPRLF